MAIIDVLSWIQSPNVVAFRHPNSQLNTKTQLIVSEGQEAVFVKEGQFYGPLLPGRHTLETKNLPFLTKMMTTLVTSGGSPFTAEVWFVQKTVPLDVKWGTSDPILLEDPKYHIALPVRAFGQYGFRIVDSCRFLAMLVGRVPAFTEKTLTQYFKGIIITQAKTAIASVMSTDQCSLLNIGTRLTAISAELEKSLTASLTEYGVEIKMFTVNSISTDANDPSVVQLKKALSKRAEMDILGYSYAQERSFNALEAAAGNQGSAGAAMGAVMGMGMGVGVAAPLGNAMATAAQNVTMSVARHCTNCGAQLQPNARFCGSCGTKVG